jgi:hypothetical protein
MIELKDLLKPARDVSDELRRLDLMAADAKKTLKTAGATGDIEDPKVQRKVGDARIRLDLVKGRRTHIESENARLDDDLRAAYRKEAARWNRLVMEAKAALVEARIQANLPYWDGDEHACRRLYDGGRMEEAPIFYRFSRAFCSETPPCDDPIKAAELLTAHINRAAKALGWTEEQMSRIPTKPAPRAAGKKHSEKVIVRALRVLPAIGVDEKALKEGKPIEVNWRDYQALGRYLELVEEPGVTAAK